MRETPDIDPELYGLLEEITSNPRSAIRVIPRKAFSPWLEGSDVIQSGDIARHSAARHLVAAYREELAQLLLDAAKIAYWQAPLMSHAPIGQPTLQIATESWSRRTRIAIATESIEAAQSLLAHHLTAIRPESGSALARASLSLVPSDTARAYLGYCLKTSHPLAALRSFAFLAERARSVDMQARALRALGAVQCILGRFREALNSYQRSLQRQPGNCVALCSIVNLGCLLSEAGNVRHAASQLELLKSEDLLAVNAFLELTSNWRRQLAPEAKVRAAQLARGLSKQIPPQARRVVESYENV